MKISIVTPTNDPLWLEQCWWSLKRQTHQDFEWIVLVNNLDPDIQGLQELANGFAKSHEDDVRVRILHASGLRGVGALKNYAFMQATGDVMLELDHDDLLHPRALEQVDAAFNDETIDFVYSDCIDFLEPGAMSTYHDAHAPAWRADGWQFRDGPSIELPDEQLASGVYPVAFPPSALSLSTILWAPNHLRAWRRTFYVKIGGHDPAFAVCDDLDLLQRTYLAGRMKKIDEPLYHYRVRGDGANTWRKNVEKIHQMSDVLRTKNLHALVAREMTLRGLPCVDLGGAFNTPGAPWIPVDKRMRLDPSLPLVGWMKSPDDSYYPDLNLSWPFKDSSIGAFRAFDLLEHLSNKRHTMSEIYRCLVPGGWLLSSTPYALGDGAFQDPTHCSYWVPNSFRYYTEARLAQYIGNTTERFMACRLFKTVGEIPYVVADMISLKGDDGSLPGRRMI